MIKVMNSVFGVDKRSASSFINASGNVIKPTSDNLQDRPSGVTFLCFDCKIVLTQEDASIRQDPFYFQFSLQFPHQHFDTINNKVEDISSPEKKDSAVRNTIRRSIRDYWRIIKVVSYARDNKNQRYPEY